jgi:hypothetical protein
VITPAPPSFATVALGGTSMAMVMVMNTGGATVPGVSAMLSGGNAADFTIAPDGCGGNDLIAGASCALTLVFHPSAAGTRSTSLLVAGTSGGSSSTSVTATATVHLTVALQGTGSGTVTSSSPAGIACPPTCAADLAATSVLLTATPAGDSVFGSWSTCAGNPCSVALDADKSVQATFTLVHVCVDAASGNDNNAGTCAAPFKTIKKAFTIVPADGTVELRPGTYSAASNGETFPIVVPPASSWLATKRTRAMAPRRCS